MGSDPTTNAIVRALADGRAYTPAELARFAGAATATVHERLSALVEAGWVNRAGQNRHQYFALAHPEKFAEPQPVALPHDTRSASSAVISTGPRDAVMRQARSCYDHLAGPIAIAMAERLGARGHLIETVDGFELTADGDRALTNLGVEIASARQQRRKFAPACLDWSERRMHIAGALGAALLAHLHANSLISKHTPGRGLTVTDRGQRWFSRHFEIQSARPASQR